MILADFFVNCFNLFLDSASDTRKPLLHVRNLLSLGECGDALEVAAASAVEKSSGIRIQVIVSEMMAALAMSTISATIGRVVTKNAYASTTTTTFVRYPTIILPVMRSVVSKKPTKSRSVSEE